MAAGTTPVFVATPRTWYAFPATADTSLTAPAASEELAAGVANGSVVELVRVKSTASIVTACPIRLFLSLDSGTTKRLIHEFMLPVTTISTTVAAAADEWVPTVPLVLPNASAKLYVTTHGGDDVVVIAQGGDY